MLCGSLDGRGVWEKNGYMYIYGGVPLLSTWNCHNIINQLYSNKVKTKQKNLNNPDNHKGVITHLEPDILECEVQWALGSITMNKASGGDGIPVELFQIIKDDALEVLP